MTRRRGVSRPRSDRRDEVGAEQLGLRLEGTRNATAAVVRLVEALFGPMDPSDFRVSRDSDGAVGLVYGRISPQATAVLSRVGAATTDVAASVRRTDSPEGLMVDLRLWGTRAVTAAAAAVLRETTDVLKVSKFYANRGTTTTGRVFVRLVIANDGPAPGVVRAHAVRIDRKEIAAGRLELTEGGTAASPGILSVASPTTRSRSIPVRGVDHPLRPTPGC